MTKRWIFSIAILGLLAGLAKPAAAAEPLDGFWIDSDGEVILEIGPCAAGGAARCGKVAWLKQPNGADGKPQLDDKNPDPKLRSRPVCGLNVVTGFKRQSADTWGGGTVYVSDYGTSFSGSAQVLGATQVKVTGYVGIPFFGSSEVWSKVTQPVTPCWIAAASSAPAGSSAAATQVSGAKR